MIIKQSERFSESLIDEEIVLMRIDTGEFFSITGTGREIWQLIDGVRDRAALLVALDARFDAPRGEIAADLDAFLQALADAELVALG